MSEATPLLAVSNLSVEFRTRSGIVRALEKIGFEVARGETVALVGESGSGKSVTAYALLGLLDPAAQVTSGRIIFGGLELLRAGERALEEMRGRKFSLISQNPRGALNPIRPVGKQLEDVLVRHGSVTRAQAPARAVQISRGQAGEFALRAKINGVNAPMVIDTGATSVVLTYETAKAAGLPLELLEYDVDVETAGGHTKAARLTLDRLAIGQLVERSVPALVVPHGQMKTNLLGMSFLDRLESWEVRADRLMLHGYP